MQTQEWTALAGVAVGGGLSYLTQFTTARQTAKNEERRAAAQRAEARRTEQVELLRGFIAIAQQAVRHAERRELAAERSADDWEAATTPDWLTEARGLIDRLFVTERMIHVLFPREFSRCAWDYATVVNKVMWREPGEIAAEGSMWSVLQQPQRAFLTAAREAIG
ncbi:MAG: hypothetical protein JF587_03790 [Catenulisporales bacterium]|jgi:hypothetical protein|nr:hypothetical protein [Catenulisporales bacterium]